MTDARQLSRHPATDTAETAAPDVPGAVVPPSPDAAAHRYTLGDEIARGEGG